MYTTLEATVKNGRVVPVESGVLPKTGKALIVLLAEPAHKPRHCSWKTIRKSLGWLKPAVDAATWQREIRNGWERRA